MHDKQFLFMLFMLRYSKYIGQWLIKHFKKQNKNDKTFLFVSKCLLIFLIGIALLQLRQNKFNQIFFSKIYEKNLLEKTC